MTQKQVLLNAFNMNCVGHIHHGMWTHPEDRSTEFNTLSYWTDLARLLERGLFDGLFIADILGIYDVYQQSITLTARESIQLPVNDPLMLVSAMAGVTQHPGFAVTANLSYEAPFPFARRLSTLDHLTQGRIGWNIVTGYLDSAARAMGNKQLLAHDQRYAQADQFLDVSYQLWEGSWQDDALVVDRPNRLYADATKIHPVRHQGEFYQVEGYHLSSPSPQRTPLLFQAGTSARGIQFAARHAECTFVNAATPAAMCQQTQRLRQTAVEALRNINLGIRRGEIFGIIGRSGAGKSTLIRCLNRLEDPTAGRIVIDGTDISALNARQLVEWRRSTSMIFQHFNLLSAKTVRQNIELPLKVAGVPAAVRVRKVDELLVLVALVTLLQLYGDRLSRRLNHR